MTRIGTILLLAVLLLAGLGGCFESQAKRQAKILTAMVISCETGCTKHSDDLKATKAISQQKGKELLTECHAFCKTLPYEIQKRLGK